MAQKDDKIREILRELAAEFISKESNRTSLITVTDIELAQRGALARIRFTVMPETEEQNALSFVRRTLSDFREYVHEHSRIARVPYFEAEIDYGEKNRVKIDEIAKTI